MTKNNVWLEATHLYRSPTGNRSGVGYYTENLINALAQVNTTDQLTVVANYFGKKPAPKLLYASQKSLRTKLIRNLPGKVWNQLHKQHLMPPINFLFGGKPDIVVNFNFARLPVSRGIKTLTVIHDLAYLRYPDYVEEKNRKYLQDFVPEAIRLSDRILAVSEFTKREIEEMYASLQPRVEVVPNGVDTQRFCRKSSREIRVIKEKYGIHSKYILFVGNLEPRKNLSALLRAYNALPTALKNKYSLVLVGAKGWNDSEIYKTLSRAQKENSVSILTLGYVDQEDMAALYSGATLFAWPSLYEGFGLPVLEAMACGTPTLTSNVSALPEVAENAAVLVDPQSIKGITQAMKKLLESESMRSSIVKRGYARVKKYSWEASAKELNRVIHEVSDK